MFSTTTKRAMATYKELAEQKAKIEAEMESMLQQEKETAIAGIRQQVADLGITPDEIFGKPKKAKAPAVVKYLNPETGQTWSGRGKAPAWCNSDRLKKKFLVAEQ